MDIPMLPKHLSSEFFEKLFLFKNYFCCEFDDQQKIMQLWGAANLLGLNDWTIGFSLEQVGFLQGMPMDEQWVLQDVQVSKGYFADIYFSSLDQGNKYLLFAPKTEDVERQLEYQQFHHQQKLDKE